MRVVVLGAGLAGLSAAWHLVRAGHRVTVVEREPGVGGMARSWRRGPYTLDLGPHRLHSRDPELSRHLFEVLGGRVVTTARRSRILLRGRHFDYPLRAASVVANLPPTLLVRAVVDYAAARIRDRLVGIDERSFEGWVVRRFGRTLYDEFFGAYTEKAWRMPCSEISSDWAAQRISQTSLLDAVRTTLFPPRDAARGLVREFWYPASGGIGELAASYARQIQAGGGELRLGAPLERIELDPEGARRPGPVARVAQIAIGGPAPAVLEADHVVSTLPLATTVRCLCTADGRSPLTDEERAAATELQHVAIVFVYVEVPRPSAMPDHWMYLPGRELTVHRLSEFKNFSSDAAPAGSTAVCCEITCRAGDERWRLADAEAGALAMADLERIGLLAPGEGRLLDIARLPRAYPVYDHAYRGRLELLRAALRRVAGLTSTGRQGLFRYNNMDHSIAMGRKAARALGRADEPAPALPAGVSGAELAAAAEYFG